MTFSEQQNLRQIKISPSNNDGISQRMSHWESSVGENSSIYSIVCTDHFLLHTYVGAIHEIETNEIREGPTFGDGPDSLSHRIMWAGKFFPQGNTFHP